MNYKECTDFLFNSFPLYQNLGAGAYKEGLDNITNFCERLGNPQDSFPAIHVAGTNGKGSVSHMLASVLQHGDRKVGLFTSPHLVDFRERIRIDGSPVAEEEVTEFVTEYGEEMKERGLSFFEMTTAMAFHLFARRGVDVAVIETGLGGRLDATNIITPLLSVITNIGLEHTHLLGDTIAKIASEKAGIIKSSVAAVIGEKHQESVEVFKATAERCGAPLAFAEEQWSVEKKSDGEERNGYLLVRKDGERRMIETDLLGDYQSRNIVTVMTAIDELNARSGFCIGEREIIEGLASVTATTGLMGRWQILSRRPLTVCDTGHNPHGFKHVVTQISRQRYRTLHMVLGMVNDKDFNSIMPLLPEGRYIFTQPSVARALPADVLHDKAAEYGIEGRVVRSVAEAYEEARREAGEEDMIFVGGSTFVVADLLTAQKRG